MTAGGILLPQVSFARWWPMVIGGDEASSAWTTDANTFWLIHDAVAQGDPDIGSGAGLNVANSTLTDPGGTIPAATGAPPYRTLSAGMYFTCEDALKNVIAQSTFSLLVSFSINNVTLENCILDWLTGDDGAVQLKCADLNGNGFRFGCSGPPVKLGLAHNDEVPYTLSTGVRYWAALACDGINPTWMGIATSFPNSKSDFVATLDGSAAATWTSLTNSRDAVWGNAGAGDIDGNIYTFGLSSAYKF